MAALAPAADATIEEAWNPVGLAGTRSHDVHFRDVFVPCHRTFAWPSGRPRSPYPATIFAPSAWFISLGAAATHLGLAPRALDEARNELRGKKDRYTQRPHLENAAIQRSLEADVDDRNARRAGLRGTAHAGAGRRGDSDATGNVNRPRGLRRGRRERHTSRRDPTAPHAGGELPDAPCSANLESYELTGRVRCGIDRLSFRV